MTTPRSGTIVRFDDNPNLLANRRPSILMRRSSPGQCAARGSRLLGNVLPPSFASGGPFATFALGVVRAIAEAGFMRTSRQRNGGGGNAS